MPPANKEIKKTASIATIVSVIHLVNNRIYIHVHAVIYSVTFNYFTYVCRNKSPTGLML